MPESLEQEAEMEDENYVWLDPLLRVCRQPRVLGAATRSMEGQIGHSCLTPAKCRTRTGFRSDSKVEFGSGPVSHTCYKAGNNMTVDRWDHI
ncbi:unnamed protein product [Prunus armeniaca]